MFIMSSLHSGRYYREESQSGGRRWKWDSVLARGLTRPDCSDGCLSASLSSSVCDWSPIPPEPQQIPARTLQRVCVFVCLCVCVCVCVCMCVCMCVCVCVRSSHEVLTQHVLIICGFHQFHVLQGLCQPVWVRWIRTTSPQ